MGYSIQIANGYLNNPHNNYKCMHLSRSSIQSFGSGVPMSYIEQSTNNYLIVSRVSVGFTANVSFSWWYIKMAVRGL